MPSARSPHLLSSCKCHSCLQERHELAYTQQLQYTDTPCWQCSSRYHCTLAVCLLTAQLRLCSALMDLPGPAAANVDIISSITTVQGQAHLLKQGYANGPVMLVVTVSKKPSAAAVHAEALAPSGTLQTPHACEKCQCHMPSAGWCLPSLQAVVAHGRPRQRASGHPLVAQATTSRLAIPAGSVHLSSGRSAVRSRDHLASSGKASLPSDPPGSKSPIARR